MVKVIWHKIASPPHFLLCTRCVLAITRIGKYCWVGKHRGSAGELMPPMAHELRLGKLRTQRHTHTHTARAAINYTDVDAACRRVCSLGGDDCVTMRTTPSSCQARDDPWRPSGESSAGLRRVPLVLQRLVDRSKAGWESATDRANSRRVVHQVPAKVGRSRAPCDRANNSQIGGRADPVISCLICPRRRVPPPHRNRHQKYTLFCWLVSMHRCNISNNNYNNNRCKRRWRKNF